MSVQRRLAAILAADVVGYSRLMERDEAGTLAALKSRRTTVLNPLVAKHQGRIFKTTGDGVLIEFASAVGALECAVELQREMDASNGDLPQERRIRLRIGINLGDVLVEGSDLYGEGVNVAARLEPLAEPGGICISEAVLAQVRGRVAVHFEDMGEQSLKNIATPVRAFAVREGRPETGARPSLKLPDKPSIAVLPFANLSGDAEQEYFADGIVEEIITALSRMRWLFVIARNSSFTYKGRAIDVKQVGRELGVRYVLEGSVRKAGNKVRITGQLIDGGSGAHLWADRFDGPLEDLFDLQDQVTANVVGAIAPKLQRAEIERSKRKPTDSLDAYDYYLRGLAETHRFTRESIEEALRLFHKAAELDQDFAAAYGMAASCYLWRKGNGWTTDRAEDVNRASHLAHRALALGKDDPIALCMAGIVLAYVVGEPATGAAYLDQALALDPNLAVAWGFRAWACNWLGDPTTALDHIGHALRLSPLEPLAYNWYAAAATACLLLGRYDESVAWAERATREAPTYSSAVRTMVASQALAGRIEEAKKTARRLGEIDPTFRIADLIDRAPIRSPEDLARYADGLRKAGLPE